MLRSRCFELIATVTNGCKGKYNMYDYDYELYTMIIELSPFKLFHKLDNDQEFQL